MPDRDFPGDESYFEAEGHNKVFDASLLQRPLTELPARKPLIFSPQDCVTQAMRSMQGERSGCVLVTEDGSDQGALAGIFTERDVLFRIVDRGRNPANLPLNDVMTPDPECLPHTATVAWTLNMMAVGGFRHVPVVDEKKRPVYVISVRDVVELLVSCFPRDILNLPPQLRETHYTTREGA